MERRVEPELLDEMVPTDPRAEHSRRDIQRLNWLMGNARIVGRMAGALCAQPPKRVAEIGAGDGAFMLALAERVAPSWPNVTATLLDRHDSVEESTRRRLADCGWTVREVQADVLNTNLAAVLGGSDLIVANLFLHHFSESKLAFLVESVSTWTNRFICCEPRRCWRGAFAARLIRLCGCNSITRHDAIASVRAGFAGRELSRLWPQRENWELAESPAGLFSHRFSARRLDS